MVDSEEGDETETGEYELLELLYLVINSFLSTSQSLWQVNSEDYVDLGLWYMAYLSIITPSLGCRSQFFYLET